MPATIALIVGDTGSGKSTAIEALPPEQTFIIMAGKSELPFKGWRKKYKYCTKTNPGGNLIKENETETILKLMDRISVNRPEIKYLVLDDSQYTVAFEFLRKAKEVGYGKFTDMALNMVKIATKPESLRDDLIVFLLHHVEKVYDGNGNEKLKAKTLGKLIDDKITYEGLFSIVLYCTKKETKSGIEHVFITNGDMNSTVKSPRGMFEEKEIPNDLLLVAQKIKEYEMADA